MRRVAASKFQQKGQSYKSVSPRTVVEWKRVVASYCTIVGMLGITYGYDAASRLAVSDGGVNSSTYSYLAKSPLVGRLRSSQTASCG